MACQSSFYDEHIYGNIISGTKSTTDFVTDAVGNPLPLIIDPVVRNKNPMDVSENLTAVSSHGPTINNLTGNNGRSREVKISRQTITSTIQSPNLSKNLERGHQAGQTIHTHTNRQMRDNMTEKNFEGKSRANSNHLNLIRRDRFELVRDSTSPLPTVHRLVEEEDNHGQYRTTLFVISQSSQKQSPFPPDEANGSADEYQQRTAKFVAKDANPEQRFGIEGTSNARLEQNEVTFEQTKWTQPTRTHDRGVTKITFQGPGRYVEEKPHYQVLPSPRQMEINPVLNGIRNNTIDHIRAPHFQSPPPLLVKRNDFNQIVVDIKPRDLHDAEKRQHVSQWIEVGTLGDTVSSKMDDSELNIDDTGSNLIVAPADYEELGYNEAGANRITILRDDSDEEQIDSASQLQQQNEDYDWPENRYQYDYLYARRTIFDAIPEEPSTPETTPTASVKSSLHVSITAGSDQANKKIYEGVMVNPTPVHRAGVCAITESKHVPSQPYGEKLRYYRKSIKPTECELREQITLMREPGEVPTRTPDYQNINEVKSPPPVPPKPNPLITSPNLTDRKTRTAIDIDYSKIPQQKHGTFPRSAVRGTRPARDPLNLELYTVSQSEVSDKKPIGVKDLTAFFSALIQDQSTNERSKSPVPVRSHTPDGRLHSSAHSAHENDILRERDRRLKAVEALRRRSATSRTLDYSKLVHEKSLDEDYPYVRPSSAPRLRSNADYKFGYNGAPAFNKAH